MEEQIVLYNIDNNDNVSKNAKLGLKTTLLGEMYLYDFMLSKNRESTRIL
jgi:hypothetical protein